MESSVARTLVSKLTKLKPKGPANLINIHRLPCYYDEYKHISLYAGDWRRIKCDCVYLRRKEDFARLQVLAKMVNRDASTSRNLHRVDQDDEFIESEKVIEGARYVYFGDLDVFPKRALKRGIKSLVIPLELLHSEDFGEHLSRDVVNSLIKMDTIDRIAICAHSNNLWNFYNQLLRYPM